MIGAATAMPSRSSEPASKSSSAQASGIRLALTPDGRFRSEGERDLDRSLLVASHLWPFIGALTATLPVIWIGMLVFWVLRKDQSPLVDDQGREIINTLLTLCVMALSVITIIGIPFFLVWLVVWLVACVRGAIAAGRAEYFRYPMTIRFIS
jgi:uncharacterized Tic20 family protein